MSLLLAGTAYDEAYQQHQFVLNPKQRGKLKSFVAARLGICTIGMTLCWHKGLCEGVLEKGWDIQVVDEAQNGATGDHQLLSSRVKRDAGVTLLVGDKEQERTGALASLTPQHILALERAFCGGLLHPALGGLVSILRAALVGPVEATATARRLSIQEVDRAAGFNRECCDVWRSIARTYPSPSEAEAAVAALRSIYGNCATDLALHKANQSSDTPVILRPRAASTPAPASRKRRGPDRVTAELTPRAQPEDLTKASGRPAPMDVSTDSSSSGSSPTRSRSTERSRGPARRRPRHDSRRGRKGSEHHASGGPSGSHRATSRRGHRRHDIPTARSLSPDSTGSRRRGSHSPPTRRRRRANGGDTGIGKEHPLDALDQALLGPTMLPLYNALLRRATALAIDADLTPFTIEEAYGLSTWGGVAPLALVHTNRMPEPQAAVLGEVFGYLSEPLSGTGRPCPPGPGLQSPWIAEIPLPWIVVDVPLEYIGPEYLKEREQAKRTGRPAPGNLTYRQIAACLAREIAARFPNRVGTCDTPDFGQIRTLFAYRSNTTPS